MLSKELKIYLYNSIIDAIKLKKDCKNKYNETFASGLLCGYQSAFIGDTKAFMYVYNAINELDIDAIVSLLWYDCDVRA